MRQLFEELKRRNVYKVAVTYAVVAFVVWQVASLLFPALDFPAWTVDFVIVLTLLGFPVALVLAWAFELTPEGVRRTPEAEEGLEPATGDRPRTRLAVKVLGGFGLAGAAVAGGWYLLGGGSETGARAGDRSIAVLPFDNLSGAEEAQPFVNGIHDDLLTRLSNISDLKVISRTSVLRYRETELGVPAIADRLGVGWVVVGGVQQAGDEVQVNAQLIQAEEDVHHWAETYRRQLTTENVFEVQSELTKKIAHSLEAELPPDEKGRVEREPTESLDAYRLYVRARSLLDQQTQPGMRQAAAWFRRAIEEDSTYALAWSGLADALLYLAEYGYAPTDSILPSARVAVQRALRLDSTSAEVHVSRAFLHAAQGNGPVLLRELERAIDLRPSYAQARSLLGWYYPALGRPSAGLETARTAVETDPFAPEAWVNVALGHLTTGWPDSALAPARRARELQPDYPAPRFYEALALLELGRFPKADSLLRGLDLAWAPSAPRTTRALVRLAAGNPVPARDLLKDLPAEGEALFYRGLLHAALAEEDAAFSAFGRIDGWERSPLLGWPNISLRYLYPRALGSLRDDRRYQQLIADINRAWGLNPDGSLPDKVDLSFEMGADE